MPLKAHSDVWYSAVGGELEDDPGYFDSRTLEWTGVLEANWRLMRDELLTFIEQNHSELKPYFNKKLVSGPAKWKTCSLLFWDWRFDENCERCPSTMQVLRRIPELVSASVSILEPNTELFPHRGDTDAIFRCHLPLVVPESLPNCGFRVNGEDRSWEEGKLLVFSDAALHSAWNRSENRRYVLIVDVIRPEFAHLRRSVCSSVLASLMVQYLWQQFGLLKTLPPWSKLAARATISRFVALGLVLRGVHNPDAGSAANRAVEDEG